MARQIYVFVPETLKDGNTRYGRPLFPQQALNGLRMLNSILTAAMMVLSTVGVAGAESSLRTASQFPESPLRKGKWEYLETIEKVAISRKHVGKRGLFAVRGETVIEASIDRVAGVIYDESRWKEWSGVVSAKLLQQHPDNQKTVYQAFGMPAMISHRDVIYTFGATRIGETLFVSGRSSSRTFPGAPKTIGVRMDLVGGDWYLTPTKEGHTHVVLEVLMDPKGYLPVWFVNFAQRRYPLNTLNGLRKQTLKADIKPFPGTSVRKLLPN